MADRFDTTRWSLILHSGGEGSAAGTALASLCRIYRPPVLAYIRARRVCADDAEDLTQAFFVHLLEQRLAARADRTRGKFRAFLLTSLKNFLSNEQTRSNTQRRGSGMRHAVLDDRDVDDADGPDAVFERAWAQAILGESLRRLEAEATQAGKQRLFGALRPFLLELPEAEDYARIADELGLRRNTLAVAVHRLRARLQELVEMVMQDTLSEAAELEQERRQLRALFRAATPA